MSLITVPRHRPRTITPPILYLPLWRYQFPQVSKDWIGHDVSNLGSVWTPLGHSFDGVDDYLQPADESKFDGLTGWTIESCVKLDTYRGAGAGNWQTIISKRSAWSATGIPFELQFNRSVDTAALRTVAIGSDYSLDSLQTPAQMPAQVWYQIASTWDGATLSLYVNGNLSSSMAAAGTITNNNQAVEIGTNVASEAFDGIISELVFYNRGLSAVEILAHYLQAKRRLSWI